MLIFVFKNNIELHEFNYLDANANVTSSKTQLNNIKRSYDEIRPSSSLKSLPLESKSLDRKNVRDTSSLNKSVIEKTRNELERRKRELKLLEKEYEKKRLLEEKRKNEVSLDKIKHMQQRRYSMNRPSNNPR